MTPTASSPGPERAVTALFTTKEGAERAYRAAIALGYDKETINLVMSDETRERHFATSGSALASQAREEGEGDAKAADQVGGPVGGTVGTVTPVLAVLGTLLLVPGLGLVAGGPIAVALMAAGAAGIAGGIIGALTNWGIPKSHVEQYEQRIRAGGILLGVQARTEEDARKLAQEWEAGGGDVVQS